MRSFQPRRLLPVVLGLAMLFASAFLVHAADISITAANVKQVSGTPQIYTAGGTITAGMPVYLDSSSQVQAAKATTSTLAAVIGIALNNASSGQPVSILTSGTITIGGTVVKGTMYVVSAANAGGIAPQADLATGNYLSIIGYASTTANIVLINSATGVTIP